MNTANKPITLIRLKQVKARTGLSTSTIYLRMSEGTFPKQIFLRHPETSGSVAWIESEITAWIEKCIGASRAAA